MGIVNFAKLVRQLIAPQSDLFQPVARIVLDVSKSQEVSGTMCIEYIGTYEVRVDISREILPYQQDEFSCTVRFVLTHDDKVIVETANDIAKAGRLCSFSVPEDVPTKKNLRFSFKVIAPNPKLQSVCAPVKMTIVHGTTK